MTSITAIGVVALVTLAPHPRARPLAIAWSWDRGIDLILLLWPLDHLGWQRCW
jgi:hypothetical protein